MNGLGKYITLGILLFLGMHLAFGGDSSMKVSEDKQEDLQIYTQLRSLSKLLNNYYRDIQEYDHSNDEDSDTLRWSGAKTTREVEQLLKGLLEQRATLRTQDSKELGRLSRVERWGFSIGDKESVYTNVLGVLQLSYNLDEALAPLVKEELDKALSSQYYPEALRLIVQTSVVAPTDYPEYFSRFRQSNEGNMLRLHYLKRQYEEQIQPLESEINKEQDSELEQKWQRKLDVISQQVLPLVDTLKSSLYSKEAKRISNQILGNKRFNIQATIQDVEKGIVDLEVFGLAGTQLEIFRNQQPLRTLSPGIVREKVQDVLPRVGHYTYSIREKRRSEYVAQTYLTYNKIAVTSYQLEGNKTRVQVVDCISGKPVPGVVVYIKENYRRRTVGYQVTNKEGYVVFPYNSKSYWVTVEDSRLSDPEAIYIPALPTPISPSKYTSIEYYTDRPMYRRGQEIKVGVVAFEGESNRQNTLPDLPLSIRFLANKNAETVEIETKNATTNKQGIVELSFKIPEDQDLDDFYLENSYGSEYLNVEEYQRSYLSVSIDSLPKGYVYGQPLVIMGRTADLNGLPTPAKVQLKYNEGRMEVTSGSDGLFTITTPPIKENGWEISLLASDALGNTATVSQYIPIDSTDMPLDASRLFTETEVNKMDFIITTKTQPYNYRLLGSLENRQVFVELISSTNTVIPLGTMPVNDEYHCSLPELPSGAYKVRIYTTDGYNRHISSTSDVAYYFYSPTDSKLYAEQALFVAQPSDESLLLLGSSYPLTLSVALSRNGEVVHQEFISCKAGQIEPYALQSFQATEAIISTIKSGIPYDKTIILKGIDAEEIIAEPHIQGLEFPEQLLPSTPLQKKIKVIGHNGIPLKNAPVIVTVFDKAVADAAEDSDYWNPIGGTRDRDNYGHYPVGLLRAEALSSVRKGNDMILMAKQESAVVSDAVAMDYATPTSPNASAPIRTNFVETAYFSALLLTNSEGEVELSFTLPDTQTKYITKVYAFSTDFKTECLTEATFEVFSPLSIELSTPRFLVWGDTLQGEVMIRNNGSTDLTTTYTIKNGTTILATGEVTVAPNGTATCPFTVSASEAEELRLQGSVTSGVLSDGVERVIPLEPNYSTYIVAQPISLYKQYSTHLQLPKIDRASSPLMLNLYLDPIQLLLSQLAMAHRYEDPYTFSLFGSLHYYYVYRQLQTYLNRYPESRAYFKQIAPQLAQVEAPQATLIDRIADPQSLAQFYSYIVNEEALSQRLSSIEKTIEQYIVPSGGFRYSNEFYGASPWLTHYILSVLAGLEVEDTSLVEHLQKSIRYLESELLDDRSYYKDVLGFSLLAAEYQHPLPELPSSLRKQIDAYRAGYQSAPTHILLDFARYAKLYESQATYREVLSFIQDRSRYTQTDEEKLTLMLFLSEEHSEVTGDVVKFALQMKQNTLWYNAAVMNVTSLILNHIKPSQLTDKSEVLINGIPYTLTPIEQITGAFSRECPTEKSRLEIVCKGLESDYIFGGVSYSVTEPSADVTPTGDKLKVTKELYVRKVNEEGSITFERAYNVVKGDRLIVRYLLESSQDLSLVLLYDPRPATSQFGYDFSGYRATDQLWWSYSRRDTHDRIYIDYLPRGRHLLELEAVATNSGYFTYGPATIQSYYAPEYAGNSGGGTLTVSR